MRRLLLVAGLALFAVACASGPSAMPPTTERDPGIYDVRTGEPVTRADLWEELDDARFVIVAESHDSAADHAIQLEVVRAMADRGEVAIGMEMFQRPFQEPLDQFVAGEISEEEMLQKTEWDDRWGFAIDFYRPFWQLAVEQQRPLVALNARRELTKRIAAVGVEGMSVAERADLPELDLSSERYREWMKNIFRAHGAEMEAEAFEKFFQAQVTWDETMADTAARWGEANPDATMVVIAGRGHVQRDFGIPSRLRRRVGARPGDGAVVSIVPVDKSSVPKAKWMRRERFADYVWVR